MAVRKEKSPLLTGGSSGSADRARRGGANSSSSASEDDGFEVPAGKRRSGGVVCGRLLAYLGAGALGSLLTMAFTALSHLGKEEDSGPDVDCDGAWGDWGPCSTTCGPGLRRRSFEVRVPAENGGEPCRYSAGAWAAEMCHVASCPGEEGYLARPPLCNASVPLPHGNWTSPRKFTDMPDWMGYCFDKSMKPWDEFGWPGRNWCWARTKAKGCYASKGGLPPWYWAQTWAKHSFRRIPSPDKYTFPGLVEPDLCDRIDHGAPLQGVTAEEAARARFWITEHLGIYVINLKWSTARWEGMQARFAALGLKGERIDGIDMRPVGAIEEARRNGFIPSAEEFNLDKAWEVGRKLMANSNPGFGQALLEDWIGTGTIGCAAAHLHGQVEAHLRATKAGKDLTLIMEDDIWMQDDFVVKLYRLLTQEAPCDWDVIALSSRCPYGTCVSEHLSRVQVDGNEPAENCHGEVQYGMFAMLYRTAQLPDVHAKLKKRIWNDDRPGCVPPDVAMSAISDQIAYYSVPGNQLPGYVVEAVTVSNRLGMNR